MVNVFILTKEGKTYSTDGQKQILIDLNDIINITDENSITVTMGKNINDRKYLADALTNSETAAIAVSLDKGIYYVYGDDIATTIKMLNDSNVNGDTSWEVITSIKQVAAFNG